MPEDRKVIQITTGTTGHAEELDYHLIALCGDGSIWRLAEFLVNTPEQDQPEWRHVWTQLPPIPEPPGDKK